MKKVKFFLVGLLASKALSAGCISDGYMDKISYEPAEVSQVYINANTVYSNQVLFLYDANNNRVDSIIVNLAPQSISPSNTAPYEDGFAYGVSFNYVVPNLPSGMYNWEQKIFFIIKNPSKNADITLIYPSNTDAAYNNAGGKCLYNSGSTNYQKSNAVSFQRPFTSTELTYYRLYSDPIIQWITRLGTYNFQMIADQDLDDYSEIQSSKIIVVIGHSEYWSKAARLNFDQFVYSGKDAVVLSGNTMWWQVRYSADKTKLICYKDYNADTVSDPLLKTVNWNNSALNYPILNSIGEDYPHGAYPPSTLSNYHGWGGYKITSPSSPLLAGTGLNFHDTLSCQTREYDGPMIFGLDNQGDIILDTLSLGFCKMELIGYDWGQNAVATSAAIGYGAFIAFKKDAASGNVINVASSNWCANTPGGYYGGFGGADSLKIEQIITNSFDLLLAHANIFSTPCPCTVTALTTNPVKYNFTSYPNPTTGEWFIQSDSITGNQMIAISDADGRIVMEQILSDSPQHLDLSGLPRGTYLYIIFAENKVVGRGKISLTD